MQGGWGEGAAAEWCPSCPPPPHVSLLRACSVELLFLVAGQPQDLVKAVGAKVAQAMGAKGGGRPGRWACVCMGMGMGMGMATRHVCPVHAHVRACLRLPVWLGLVRCIVARQLAVCGDRGGGGMRPTLVHGGI